MKKPRTVSIVPGAAALVESLRGLGYSTETALADLIDNSISAKAKTIAVDMQWNDGSPVAAVLDDGEGMAEATLCKALCLGGNGPAQIREPDDLGRFGLGLKTASLSQCQRMTVISRREGVTSALVLDLGVVAQEGWVAVVPDELPEHPMVSTLAEQMHGTLVLWDQMDARSGLTGLDREAFFLRLQDVRAHLGMVFHRFLSGEARRISIAINGRPIKSWDPFQKNHPATIPMRTERLRQGKSTISVTPWVLPHRDRFANETEYNQAGGAGGWGARQGFYVYRGDRLLVAGSWLGLGGSRSWTRDDASRLARIEVNLPIGLDDDWRIDVRKSQARPPGALRPRLTAIGAACRQRAREVFAYRGRRVSRERTVREREPVWLAHETGPGTRYVINRKHPAVAAYAAEGPVPRLNALLTLIEQTVPVERIWLDVSESDGALPTTEASISELGKALADLAEFLPQDLPVSERVDLLLDNLPGERPELRDHLITLLEARAA